MIATDNPRIKASIPLEPSLHQACKQRAREHGMSLSGYIRRALINYRAIDFEGSLEDA
jgi:hypothetical protein